MALTKGLTENVACEDWLKFTRNFTPDKLELLKNAFKSKSSNDELGLEKDEFSKTLSSLFDNGDYSLQSTVLFDEISGKIKLKITWNDFIDYLLENDDFNVHPKVLLKLHNIEPVSHTKRETIIKIVLIETEKYFCYAVVSKYGRIGLYHGNLNFLTSYHVIMSKEDIIRTEDERRKRFRWVTDAIFCNDILMFIVTNTARSIAIYEASGLRHIPYWLIENVPNIVECLAYKSYEDSVDRNESVLFMGDCEGQIIQFTFVLPKHGLLRKKCRHKMSSFYWKELKYEKKYITVKFLGRIHKSNVKHIKYCCSYDAIFTCSEDPDASIVKTFLSNRKKLYVLKIKKGASCFALNANLKLVTAGSYDGKITLWNSVMVTKPIAVLLGHEASIVDVQILEKQQMLLSCSKDRVLKTWDINEHVCVQTIKISFPFVGIPGRPIEWGIHCIYPGPKRCAKDVKVDNDKLTNAYFNFNITKRKEDDGASRRCNLDCWERSNILVTCCNYIANITLKFEDKELEKTFENIILTPPPLQNSVLIPWSWRIQDDITDTPECTLEENGTVEHLEKYPESTVENLEDIKFILEKDLLESDFLRSNINYKISVLEKKKMQMPAHVKVAPYLALDLFDIDELKLSDDLPISNKKNIKIFADMVQKKLTDATIKEKALSEPSSSRSSQSSKYSSMT